jgi:hypothetical protein
MGEGGPVAPLGQCAALQALIGLRGNLDLVQDADGVDRSRAVVGDGLRPDRPRFRGSGPRAGR